MRRKFSILIKSFDNLIDHWQTPYTAKLKCNLVNLLYHQLMSLGFFDDLSSNQRKNCYILILPWTLRLIYFSSIVHQPGESQNPISRDKTRLNIITISCLLLKTSTL